MKYSRISRATFEKIAATPSRARFRRSSNIYWSLVANPATISRMLEKAAKISSIVQGLAALAFLYSYFFTLVLLVNGQYVALNL